MSASGSTLSLPGASFPSLTLSDGKSIPQLGLGVWQADGPEVVDAVKWALQAGYRHIDTASLYGNEREVGQAIRDSGVSRSEIFVTTKVWNTEQGYDRTLKACERSLKKMGLDYVDLYLIHSPQKSTRKESWRALVELQSRGKAKSIGVSNYNIRHLEELFEFSDVKPVVNQIEITPYNTRAEIAGFCEKHNIMIEAYSPLTQGQKLTDRRLVALQKRLFPTKTPAQLLIRWGVEKGYVTLPKSVRRDRIEQNADVFGWEIGREAMKEMDGWDEGLVVGWDPTVWA